MGDGVLSAGRSVSPASMPSGAPGRTEAGRSRPREGHPDLQGRGAGGLPVRGLEYAEATVPASYMASTGDLAHLSRTAKPMAKAAGLLLGQVKSLVGRAGKVASSPQPLADAKDTLGQIEKLPQGQRFLPLKALAAQVPKLLKEVANPVAQDITRAALVLTPDEQHAVQLARRGPDNGLQRGFFATGFF